jgi:hypothetical protein
MMDLRDFTYRGISVGKVNNPATQREGIYIYTRPKKFVGPDRLDLLLMCLLDGYKYKLGPSGEIWLVLPLKTKYGPILNGIARAYYELQTRKTPLTEGQQQLVKEFNQ